MAIKPSCLSPDQIEAVLKRSGINATAQRIAICRFVLCDAEHPSAEDVKLWVDQNFPKMSLATVYNTLRILVDAGLLRELRLPHSEAVLYDNNLSSHFHFLDEETGELLDVDPVDVRLDPVLTQDYQVRAVEVLLRGKRNRPAGSPS
ncbi:Peroxide-responsive repressor PerR [compost metagenome]